MGRVENSFGYRADPAILKIPGDLRPLGSACKSTHMSQRLPVYCKLLKISFRKCWPFFLKSQDPPPPPPTFLADPNRDELLAKNELCAPASQLAKCAAGPL